jgi:hypothetical protein
MKRLIPLILVGVALAECATTPATTQPTTQPVLNPMQSAYLAANNSAQLAAQVLTDVHTAGLITDADYTNIVKPALATLNAALDAWGAHLNDSQSAQAQATFQAAMPGVLQLIANAQKKAAKPSPTTKPVAHAEVIGGVVADLG